MEKWLDSSCKERDSEEDRSPKRFAHKGGNSEAKLADAVHPSEQWMEIYVKLLKDISVTVDAAVAEEDVVNSNLKKREDGQGVRA
ncbi:unnamed protein product [Peronospora destructor]|uniref:Uncharacterized protein n=1 Tax=Peronospora destructor TaxID=86335 RepID=A0AAV0TAD3_9STRA|nr:unnamed protein product [Peronospora destructor]